MTAPRLAPRGPRQRSAAAIVIPAAALLVSLLLPWGSTATASGLVAAPSSPCAPPCGDAGTDTALPPTNPSSAVTVSGGAAFPNLRVTVNQTQDLLNQAVSVTWTGGAPTVYTNSNNSGAVLGNFLQIFECWGPDDGTNAADPGPSPENCEFGGPDSAPGSQASEPGKFVESRVIGSQGTASYGNPNGYPDPATGDLWEPFRSVDGTVVDVQANFDAQHSLGQAEWLDPYFDNTTSNEDDVALTHADGTGSELFTVDTGLEAPGLGCGQQSQVLPNGTKQVPQCWLVIVPRSTSDQENDPADTDFPGGPGLAVSTSPLYPAAWQNRVSIPLGFEPIGASCPIGADEVRIVGSELATPAVTSWQPTLCSTPGSPPYNFASISDDQAREQLVSGATGSPGMAVVSRPIDPGTVGANDPVVYSPLTLSGVTIGFNIERTPNGTDPAEAALAGIRVANVNLTPRLVAKLLTESYPAEFLPLHLITDGKAPAGYQWILNNPDNLVNDPDFLQYNPEFVNLQSNQSDTGSLVVEEPNSDAAYALWQWVLADPEASAWLAGAPDPWGMKVNPLYSTNARVNPSGVFGTPVPDSYPKSDPYCWQAPPGTILDITAAPRPLCMLDASPYAGSMQVAAQDTRLANDGATTTPNQNALTADTAWSANPSQFAGYRFIMSVTDTADAAQYGLQEAGLSPAGEDSPERSFVAPDPPNLLAGEEAMVPSSVPGVLQPDPSSTATGAYPLTMLTYAAVTPRSLNQPDRAAYSHFITYAVGQGQVPGQDFGDLPLGYAPLPASLVSQATTAAALVGTGDPAPQSTGTSAGGPSRSVASGDATSDGLGATAALPSASASPLSPTAPSSDIAFAARPRSSRTPLLPLGLIRYTLPLLVLIGLGAVLGTVFLDRWAKRRSKPGSGDAGAPC